MPSTPSSRRKFLLIASGLFLVLWAIFTIMDWRTGTIRGDFTSYSLEASRVMWQGGNPYDREEVGRNYKYFPTNIIVLSPFTLLPIPVAQGLWTTMNLYLILGAIWMQWRFVSRGRLPWWLLIALAIFGFRAIHGNLKMGQWNTSVYSLGVIGAILLYQGRNHLGAIILGLAASLKFLPAYFLIPFVMRRKWKPCFFSVASLAAWLLLIPLVVVGPQRLAFLFDEFKDKATKVMGDTVGARGERVGISLNALVYLYLNPAIREDISPEQSINGLNLSDRAAHIAAGTASGLFVAGALFLTWYRRNSRPEGNVFHLMLGLWVCTFLLAMPHVRVHYLIYAITPCIAVLSFWYLARGLTRAAWFALGTLILAFVCQITTSQDAVGRKLSTWINLHGGNALLLISLYIGCAVGLLQSDKLERVIDESPEPQKIA